MQLWTSCGEAAANARLEAPLKRFLQSAVSDASLHSRFLNMLSLLEHVGSRKIMLSQMKGAMDKEILKHMAEETRHAFFFKNQAERLAGKPLDDFNETDTLCPAEARAYFGKLDAGITKLLNNADKRVPYVWVSFIVEIRAGWVYHFYQDALSEAKSGFSLKSVLAEEEMHLAEMQEALKAMGAMSDITLARAAALETQLFEKLLTALLEKSGNAADDVWKKSLTA